MTAGTAYAADADAPSIPTRSDLAAPGTVLRDDNLGPTSMYAGDELLPEVEVGDTLEFYREMLAKSRRGATEPARAADVVTLIESVQFWWTLSDLQQSNLLELAVEQGDLELLGTTTDRDGRPAFAFGATTAKGFHQAVLLVSTESGRILGSEWVYLGGLEEMPVPPHSVMSYTLWELPAEADAR